MKINHSKAAQVTHFITVSSHSLTNLANVNRCTNMEGNKPSWHLSHIPPRRQENSQLTSESSGITLVTPAHNNLYKHKHPQLLFWTGIWLLGLSCHLCVHVSEWTHCCTSKPIQACQAAVGSRWKSPFPLEIYYSVLKEFAQSDWCRLGMETQGGLALFCNCWFYWHHTS